MPFLREIFAAVRPRRAVAVRTDCTFVFMRSERDNAGMRGGQSSICAAGKAVYAQRAKRYMRGG